MTVSLTLAMTGKQHARLAAHLFPGDGKEAAAIALCARSGVIRDRLSIHEIIGVPYEACRLRRHDVLIWPGEWVEEAIERAENDGSSIILMHSHPGGMFAFSDQDDRSDAQLMPSLIYGVEHPEALHGSAIMVPSGALRVRVYNEKLESRPVNKVVSVGTNIVDRGQPRPTGFRMFSEEMVDELRQLRAAVIGVSGTGSIVAESIARLGIGGLLLVDADHIEHRNLDRILNATNTDADTRRFKTHMMAAAIDRYRQDCTVTTLRTNVEDPRALEALADVDVIFCCVDTMEGRYWCEVVARAYNLPLIDMGVCIPTYKDEQGRATIADACARVDYAIPDQVSLTDRGVITESGLRLEYLQRVAPQELEDQILRGYIKGSAQLAQPVIMLNMQAASLAVIEWLARCYELRLDDNALFARTQLSLAAMETETFTEWELCEVPVLRRTGLGRNDPALSTQLVHHSREAA